MIRVLIILTVQFYSVCAFASSNGIESTLYDEAALEMTMLDTDLALVNLEAELREIKAKLSEITDNSGVNNDIVVQKVHNELLYVTMLCGMALISLIVILLFVKSKAYTSRDVVSAAGLTLIIFGTIILVLVVNTTEQLTAAIGVLGAIAGYLFRSVQEGVATVPEGSG